MTWNSDEIRPRVEAAVQELADRGFRSLGVAVSWSNPQEEEEKWEFMGVLSVFDPPRVDAVETIKQAHENMVEVKMITGDQAAIAKETCRMLGMGTTVCVYIHTFLIECAVA
jgi:H+-transporting ATPase